MQGVEVRAKITDVEAIKSRLVLLWYSFSQPLFQQDRTYLSNDLLFTDIQQGTVIIKIRNSNGKYTLMLKKRGETKFDNIEREVTIDDSDQAAEILKYMWYYQVVEVSKVRWRCSYNNITICLDEVEGLGSFIKVERLIDADDVQAAENLSSFLENLWVSADDYVSQSYDDMIYHQRGT